MVIASRATAASLSSFASNLLVAFSNSINAAIAVLNAWRRSMSSPTFWMVSCVLRRKSCASLDKFAVSIVVVWLPVSKKPAAKRHTRFKKRFAPSTPASDHSKD